LLIWSTENCFNTDVMRGVIVNSKCNRNHLTARLPVVYLGISYKWYGFGDRKVKVRVNT